MIQRGKKEEKGEEEKCEKEELEICFLGRGGGTPGWGHKFASAKGAGGGVGEDIAIAFLHVNSVKKLG